MATKRITDKERLDWVQKAMQNHARFYHFETGEFAGFSFDVAPCKPTFRAAIDAAIRAERSARRKK